MAKTMSLAAAEIDYNDNVIDGITLDSFTRSFTRTKSTRYVRRFRSPNST